MKWILICCAALASNAVIAAEPEEFREDAQLVEQLVEHQYAYLDRLPSGEFELTPKLRAEAEAVKTKRQLVRFAERALTLLADHHTITGAPLSDSWAVFPSFGDLWIERRGKDYVVE
jgi:cob(I)alamin adenosyltransferase